MEECTQITMEEYLGMKKEIRENITGIVKSFVTIGQTLMRIDQTRAYELDGYKSVTEMAKAEYGMSPGGVSRFLGVYKKYCEAGQLKEGYENYNYAQLVEMLNLPEEDAQLITPETDRQSIRELKKFNKEGQSDMHALENWKDQTPEEAENRELMAACLKDMFKMESQSDYFNRVCQCVKTGEPTQKFAEELNPSGNRTVRSGRAMAFFYEKEVKLKVWSRAQVTTVDYEWMQDIFTETFAESLEQENEFWKWQYRKEEMLQEQNREQETEQEEQHEEPKESARDSGGTEKAEDRSVGSKPVQETKPERPEKKPEIAPAQKDPEKPKCEKCSDCRFNYPESPARKTAFEAVCQECKAGEKFQKYVEPEPQKPEEPEQEEQLEEDQIPGQDTVMNHPELLPAGMEAQTTATIDGEETHATVEPTREQRKDECLALVSMIQGNIGIENYEAALKQARKLEEQLEALVI